MRITIDKVNNGYIVNLSPSDYNPMMEMMGGVFDAVTDKISSTNKVDKLIRDQNKENDRQKEMPIEPGNYIFEEFLKMMAFVDNILNPRYSVSA